MSFYKELIGSGVTTLVIGIITALYLAIAAFGLFCKFRSVNCKSKKKLDEKTVLVTGGTNGMGLEIAKDLARRGARVIIACPFFDEGMAAELLITKQTGNQKVVFKHLDLSSLSSVRALAKDILKTEARLDILINNAGVIFPDKITADGMHFIMQVNYFGHFLLTHLLLPLLKKTGLPAEPSRIINVASKSHIIGRINFNNMHKNGISIVKYFDSKLCVVLFSREASKRLKGTDVIVNIADPGIASTKIADPIGTYATIAVTILLAFYPKACDGAQTALHLALDDEAGKVSGEYFENCKLSSASQKADNEELCRRLWKESLSVVKLEANEIDPSFYSPAPEGE